MIPRPCPGCGGDGAYVIGNPIDSHARLYECDACEGSREVPLGCSNCRDPAVEFVWSDPMCAACAAREKDGAFCLREDAA